MNLYIYGSTAEDQPLRLIRHEELEVTEIEESYINTLAENLAMEKGWSKVHVYRQNYGKNGDYYAYMRFVGNR